MRDRVKAPKEITEDQAKKAALESQKVKKHIAKEIKKIIYVPGRLINIVTA